MHYLIIIEFNISYLFLPTARLVYDKSVNTSSIARHARTQIISLTYMARSLHDMRQ